MSLQETPLADGLTVFQSSRFRAAGLPHAFSTRSLNLEADWAAHEWSHHESGSGSHELARFATGLGCQDRRLARVRQVHGNAVAIADEATTTLVDATNPGLAAGMIQQGITQPPTPATADATPSLVEADALVTASPRVLLIVQTADCVPILLAERRGQVVAAVHAGWRGVVANVIAAAVNTAQAVSQAVHGDAGRWVAAIGPCVSRQHFEVGPEVARAFASVGLEAAIDQKLGPKPHIDLVQAARMQLLTAGLTAEAVESADLCTFAQPAAFFSYRRDGAAAGRQIAAIGPIANAA